MYVVSCDYDDCSSKGWSRMRGVYRKGILGVLGKSTYFAPKHCVVSIQETD